MGHKAMATTCAINNASGPGTANERTVQWWFKEFRGGDEGLEGEEHSRQQLEGDKDQCGAITETDPLTTTWEIPEELNVDHSMVVWHSKQSGKVKKLSKRVPHKQTEIQTTVILKC